jgi:hypothetical protein
LIEFIKMVNSSLKNVLMKMVIKLNVKSNTI